MFTVSGSETFWLNATNVVLGLVTLVCIAIMVRGVVLDLRARLATRNATLPVHADDHAFVVPTLGLTMADGGERTDKNAASSKQNTAPQASK